MLDPLLVSPVQERHGLTEASPAQSHEDHSGGEAESTVIVQSAKGSAQGCLINIHKCGRSK